MNTRTSKVLIIDDEPSHLYLLVKILEHNGFEATTCHDAREAMKYFERLHPDLVLMDLNMPHENGHSLCEKMRLQAMDTPIIIISGETDPQIKAQLLNSGADDFISKPISISETQSRIQSILSKHNRIQMLKEEIDNIKTFSRALAHDLTNYMNTIYGFSSLLKDDMPNALKDSNSSTKESVMDSVMTIYDFSNECSHVIESLLMLALCEDNKLHTACGQLPLAIEGSVNEQMKIFSIDKTHITFEDAPTTDVIGDTKWLKIVFNNILSNAIKYATPENPKVHISFKESEDEVFCTISDSGDGMDEECINNLLQKKATTAAQLDAKGHGYGLKIATTIMQKVGGSIKYNYDKGSHFTVTLLKWKIPDIIN